MKINNLPGSMVFSVAPSNKPCSTTEISNLTLKEADSKKFNLHNMSPDELSDLVAELYESGQITPKEQGVFGFEIFVMKNYAGLSGDTKIDMFGYFSNALEHRKADSESPESIKSLERTIEILRGVDARAGVNFPISI